MEESIIKILNAISVLERSIIANKQTNIVDYYVDLYNKGEISYYQYKCINECIRIYNELY